MNLQNMENKLPMYTSDSFIPLEGLNAADSYFSDENNKMKTPGKSLRRKTIDCDVTTESTFRSPKRRKKSNGSRVVELHDAINNFWNEMSPSEEEKILRAKVIEHISNIIHLEWPKAKVKTFGSSETGLLLPTSDIDMVVFGKWQYLPLTTLGKALERNGINNSDIIIIPNASVPIVRLRHTLTNFKIDICFNEQSGLKSVKVIKHFIKMYPTLPKLVLVLKQYLICRGLNEVYRGGMSSYCLTLLVISYLQGHHKPSLPCPVGNLGVQLMEFFELYGLNFYYKRIVISVANGGSYKQKPFNSENAMLSVTDPVCEGNDISKGTHLFEVIRLAFSNTYYVLLEAVTENKYQNGDANILQLILKIDDDVLRQRQENHENYSILLKELTSLCQNTERATVHPKRNLSKLAKDKKVSSKNLPSTEAVLPNSVSSLKQLSSLLQKYNICTLKKLKKFSFKHRIKLTNKLARGLHAYIKKTQAKVQRSPYSQEHLKKG